MNLGEFMPTEGFLFDFNLKIVLEIYHSDVDVALCFLMNVLIF